MSTTTANRQPSPTPSDKEESAAYLRSLLNKNLRVTTTDNRMFWGAFKCTDSESNIVLQHTYEYRHPTPQQISAAAAATTTTSSLSTTSPPTATATASPPPPSPPTQDSTTATTTTTTTNSNSNSNNSNSSTAATKLKLDMTARYLGLVVVPGKYIVRIEAEEFASQMRGREVRVLPVKQQGGVGALGGVGTAVGAGAGAGAGRGVEVV